jgi:integrase
MGNQNPTPARRSYGTGTLYVRIDRHGREVFYGIGYGAGKRFNRRGGVKRGPSARDGLTRTQAESRLAELIGSTETEPATVGTMTVEEAGRRYLLYAQRRGRKPSTISNLESELRVHVRPFFSEKPLHTISSQDVAEFVTTLERNGLAPKTVRNVLATLSAVCSFAKAPQRAWLASNPCDGVELPAVPEATEIRFLTLDGIDLLVEHARAGIFQALDRALYRTAAMTGLRRGELPALRWQDVDWLAQRIRLRQNYVRGQFGTPKSKRSTRSVPLYVAGIGRRMHKALTAVGLDETHRFHDVRHTFGTQCAAAGVAMRTLQEWMGHKDIKTTQRYADYAPSSREADMIAAAFARESAEPVAA